MLIRTSFRRWESSLDRRYPLIVGCYALALFAVVAGPVAFPFSDTLLWLLLFLVSSFFLMALVILSATCFVFAVAVFRSVCQTPKGLLRSCAAGVASEPEDRRRKPGLAVDRRGLWDRWIDGS